MIWRHLQQILRVDQTCYWCCRLWCRLLCRRHPTAANCSWQLQIYWIISAKIISFRPRHSVDRNSGSGHVNIMCKIFNVSDNACWILTRDDFLTRENCSEKRSKAKVVRICQNICTPMNNGETVETVLRTIISVYQGNICAAVSDMCEECNTCHDRTGRFVVEGQSNPLFVPNVMKTHILLTDDLAQEGDLLQRYQERIEKISQQDKLSKLCMDAWFFECCWNRTVFHDERHWRILTIHRFSGLSWVHVAKRWMFIWRKKVGSEGTPKLGPHWKLQLFVYKANMEWKLELSLWTRTIIIRGSEFLMTWMSWSRTWTIRVRTTTSRKPQKCSSKTMR